MENILRQHSSLSNPMDEDFNYPQEFKSLNLDAIKNDLHKLMTDCTAWMPTAESKEIFDGRDRKTGALKWTGPRQE